MDSHLKISDPDNRYGNPFSQPSSALPNKPLSQMDYLSPHNIDFQSGNYPLSQDPKVIIRSSLGSPYLNYPQDPIQATHSHTQSRNSLEHRHERYESNPNVDSGNYRGRSSGRRISDADLDNLKSKTSARVHGINVPQNVTDESGAGFLSSMPNSRSYGISSNLQELIHGTGTNPLSSREQTSARREQVERLMSPEAKRILNSPVAEDYKRQYPQPDRVPNRQLQPLAEPHVQTSQTSANKTTRQAVPRLTEISAPSFGRDSLENTKEYKIEEPHISKRTIYTIQNNTNTGAIKQGPTSEARSHRSPERTTQITARSSHSPLDGLRHSLKNEGTRISKIVIETVENAEEGGVFYDIQNNQEEKQFDGEFAKPAQHEPHYQIQYQPQYNIATEKLVSHEPQRQYRYDIVKEQPTLYEPQHQSRYGEQFTSHEPHYISQSHLVSERSAHEPRYPSHHEITREQPVLYEPHHQSRYDTVKEQPVHYEPHHQSRYDERPAPQEVYHQYETFEDQPGHRGSNYQSMSPSVSSLTNKKHTWSHEGPILKGASSLRQEMEELRHDINEYTRTSVQLENLAELRNREKGGFVPRTGEDVHYHYDDEHEHEHEHHHHHEEQVHEHHHHHHDLKHSEHEHHHHQEEVKEKPKKAAISPEKKVKEQEKILKKPVVVKEKKPRHLIVKGVIGLLVILLCSLLAMELFTDIDLDNYVS